MCTSFHGVIGNSSLSRRRSLDAFSPPTRATSLPWTQQNWPLDTTASWKSRFTKPHESSRRTFFHCWLEGEANPLSKASFPRSSKPLQHRKLRALRRRLGGSETFEYILRVQFFEPKGILVKLTFSHKVTICNLELLWSKGRQRRV